jgi:GH35 family endo-1,4-beta-xylanase
MKHLIIHCNLFLKRRLFLALLLIQIIGSSAIAQSIDEWYANAQQRIDTLRKGSFGVKVMDKNDQPFSGDISIRMVKHEFPFGIAFDLNEGAVNYGNAYTTTASISAPADAVIYQSERWYSFMAYAIPVEKDSSYNLTLKFAEIYFNNSGSRIFDVFIDGTKYLSNFDVFAAAGGKDIAFDSTISITASDSIIRIELVAILDNAAIKGIEIETVEGDWINRINCGGSALTTSDGHYYSSDVDYFDLNASRLPSEEQWAKAAMQKYFNYGVSGNSFKWSGIQPQHTAPNYTAFDNAVNWTQSIGWELRAHTLLWGGTSYEDDHAIPRWVKDLPTPLAITDTCKMRVIREVTRYRGIVKEYDVMNEPLHATYLASRVGDSINWNCFKWARSADPDAQLFINDYNVEYNWGDAAKYRDMILNLKSMGAPITGVGMQAHFWQGMRPNITELVTNVNIVAEAGLPIKFTEFDNGELSEADQAIDFIKVMTVAFSHPSINGLICWALSDRGAWRTESGIFDQNHKPKLAADTFYYYTHSRWATNFDTVSAGDVSTMFNAYYGNYTVEVNFGDTVKVFSISCTKENADSVFVLFENDALNKGPLLKSSQLLSDSTLTLLFDKGLRPESIDKGDFKFFSDHLLRIQNMSLDEDDSTMINVTLQGSIIPEDFLCLSYFPGNLASTDGGMALAFGPETVKNLTTGLISASVTNDGFDIEAVFNAGIRNLSDNVESFTLTDNGEELVFDELDYKSIDSSIIVFHFNTPLTSVSAPTIQYTRGTLIPSNGFQCQSSEIINVSNIWPVLDSSFVNNTGSRITSYFNTQLINVLENLNAFSVLVDGQVFEISSVSEYGGNPSQYYFVLGNKIPAGSTVTLSYQPGTVKGTNGNSMESLDGELVTNNSNFTGLETEYADGLTVYPNPANDIIYISWDSDFNSIIIRNIEGKIMVHKSLITTEKSVSLPLQLEPGIYILQLQSDIKIVNMKLVIE